VDFGDGDACGRKNLLDGDGDGDEIMGDVDPVLTASQPHGSGTNSLSAFAKPSHFLLLNAILRLTLTVNLPHPLATHHPTRPDSLIDFGAM